MFFKQLTAHAQAISFFIPFNSKVTAFSWPTSCCLVLHDDHTQVSFINDKQAFRYSNNMVSDYFHLKMINFEETKVVRLLPHLSHRLLCL